MTASEYTNYFYTDNLGKHYSDYQREVWFKAIYPNWTGDANNVSDLINFYETDFNGPEVIGSTEDEKFDHLFSNEFITNSKHGYAKNDIELNNYYATLDTSKQYFPTLEFKVGSDVAYVDGKPFKLEAAVIKSKEGRVLVPMYHLDYSQ